jgi:hypothetical protein
VIGKKFTADTIGEVILAVLNERKLHVVRPQPPTMGEVALEAYGFGKACDAVALQGDDLRVLLSEIGVRCVDVLNGMRDRIELLNPSSTDHLEEALQKITELYDDLNMHPDGHSVASIRRRASRVREHLVHARDQRVVERNAR